jgi:hypothetical protein
MIQAIIAAYPWDILDEGEARVLDTLRGELGITQVAVWAATPPVREIRLRDVEPSWVQNRGGFCFEPAEERYGSTRCKPVSASFSRTRDPFGRIVEACAQRALPIRAVVSATRVGPQAHRRPDMAAKNVFGAPSEEALCLSHPDVQAFLAALVTDLSTKYSPSAIVLADYRMAWPDPLGNPPWAPIPWSDRQRRLMSHCFCESCLQKSSAAGVKGESARRSAWSLVLSGFEEPKSNRNKPGNAWDEPRDLVAFSDWSRDESMRLLERLRDSCGCPIIVRQESQRESFGIVAPLGDSDAAMVQTPIHHVEELFELNRWDGRVQEAAITCGLMLTTEPAEVVRVVGVLADRGLAAVTFEHLGLFSDSVLATVKRAIRLGRRS